MSAAFRNITFPLNIFPLHYKGPHHLAPAEGVPFPAGLRLFLAFSILRGGEDEDDPFQKGYFWHNCHRSGERERIGGSFARLPLCVCLSC